MSGLKPGPISDARATEGNTNGKSEDRGKSQYRGLSAALRFGRDDVMMGRDERALAARARSRFLAALGMTARKAMARTNARAAAARATEEADSQRE